MMDPSFEKMVEQQQYLLALTQMYYKQMSEYRYKYQNVYSNARLIQRKRSRNELWRPWIEKSKSMDSITSNKNELSFMAPYRNETTETPAPFQHPVKLIWPKKLMYSEGEQLLKDFPVQATLEYVMDADSDDDDYDDEMEEEPQKSRGSRKG